MKPEIPSLLYDTVRFKILMSPWIVSRCEICVAQRIVSAGHTLSLRLDGRRSDALSMFHLKGGNPTLGAPPGAVATHTSHPHCDENPFNLKGQRDVWHSVPE